MSAFHFDRRQLRRTVGAMLVVWVLALASGVVNACALTPAGPVERAILRLGIVVHDAHASESASAAIESHREQVEAIGHHNHVQESDKGSCLKFCDDESSVTAKVKLPVPPLVIHVLRLTL